MAYAVETVITQAFLTIAEAKNPKVPLDLDREDLEIYYSLEDAVEDADARGAGIIGNNAIGFQRFWVEISEVYWDEEQQFWEPRR